MDEEEILDRTTRLLERGYTMLATHHSCGAPLFRCKGKIVCPVCSFGANESERGDEKDVDRTSGESEKKQSIQIIAASPSEIPPGDQNSRVLHGRQFPAQHLFDNESPQKLPMRGGALKKEGDNLEQEDLLEIIKQKLKNALLDRIGKLADSIQREEDQAKLKGKLDCLEVALRILRSL